MSSRYHQYGKRIKEILSTKFKDKKIRGAFLFSLIGLALVIPSNLSIPLLLKKIVESLSSQGSLSITLVLLSYGLLWVISQVSLHVHVLLTYKVEQRITFSLGIKVLAHLLGPSLSRFFLKNPKVGILDEATSFLDRTTEIIIQENISRLLPEMTKIITPHRSFMVDYADNVIMLDKNDVFQETQRDDIQLKVIR